MDMSGDDGGGDPEFATRYQGILQPHRDVLGRWSVNIADLLYEYMLSAHDEEEYDEDAGHDFSMSSFGEEHGGGHSVNFSQAAFMVSCSTSLYSTKVDDLWMLVSKLVSDIRENQKKKRDRKRKGPEDDGGGGDEERSDDVDDEDDDFGLERFDVAQKEVKKHSYWRQELGQLTSMKPQDLIKVVPHPPTNICVRLDETVMSDRCQHLPSLESSCTLTSQQGNMEPGSVSYTFTVNGEKVPILHDHNLYSRGVRSGRERIGWSMDQRMNQLSCNAQSMLLPYIDDHMIWSQGLSKLDTSSDFLSASITENIENVRQIEVDAEEILGPNATNFEISGVQPAASILQDGDTDNVIPMDDEDDDHCDIDNNDEEQPVKEPVRRSAVDIFTHLGIDLKRSEKKPSTTPSFLQLLDPYDMSAIDEKPKPLVLLTDEQIAKREAKMRRKLESKRGDKDNFVEQYHKLFHQRPEIYSKKSMKYSKSGDIQLHYFQMEKLLNKKLSQGLRGKKVCEIFDKEVDEDLVNEEDSSVVMEEDDSEVGVNNEEGFLDRYGLEEGAADDGNVMDMVSPLDDIPDDMFGSDFDTTNRWIRRVGDRGFEYFDKLRKENLDALCGLEQRVEEWKRRILPVLDEEESHHEFNLQTYCKRILDSFKTHESKEILFSVLVSGFERWEISRTFVCVLMLVNQLCLSIKPIEGDGGAGSIDHLLTLLSTTLHIDQLAEQLPQPGTSSAQNSPHKT